MNYAGTYLDSILLFFKRARYKLCTREKVEQVRLEQALQ